MSTPIQFNFELPEEEAARLLDVGVARGMGLSRATVQKAMVARALVIERLAEISPRSSAPDAKLAEFIAKLTAVAAASPRVIARLEATLRRSLRQKKAAA